MPLSINQQLLRSMLGYFWCVGEGGGGLVGSKAKNIAWRNKNDNVFLENEIFP